MLTVYTLPYCAYWASINILSEHFGAVCIFILGIMGQYAYMHIGANWASTHYEYWPIMPCNN